MFARLKRSVTKRLRRATSARLHDGRSFARTLAHTDGGASTNGADANPLRAFFEQRQEGAGIWKWTHYFDIYHRHLAPFRGRPVTVVEVGVYSGGSLDMWCNYFGPEAIIHGVDIAPQCRAYAGGQVRISIGDQADPAFWREFKNSTQSIDVLIDDGGHAPDQQIVTLKEMLPHLSPGGVYICEDVHGVGNEFSAFVSGFIDALNSKKGITSNRANLARRIAIPASGAQSTVESVCCYPFVTVITRTRAPVAEFLAPKHGTQWQPFLS